jgi:hypothetical protein
MLAEGIKEEVDSVLAGKVGQLHPSELHVLTNCASSVGVFFLSLGNAFLCI